MITLLTFSLTTDLQGTARSLFSLQYNAIFGNQYWHLFMACILHYYDLYVIDRRYMDVFMQDFTREVMDRDLSMCKNTEQTCSYMYVTGVFSSRFVHRNKSYFRLKLQFSHAEIINASDRDALTTKISKLNLKDLILYMYIQKQLYCQ